VLLAAPVLALQSQFSDASADAFHTIDLDWVDQERDRPVPVRLYTPLGMNTSASTPLVIFSHGIGGSRLGYSYLGTYWASHGFASLHVQHIGSDRSIWFGNPFNLVSRLQEAAKEKEALARVQDLRFALTRLLGTPLGQAIDQGKIIAAGHSYGANTTLLASGARVSRENIPINLSDPRISAAIIISAPRFYGQDALDSILQPIQIPTLHITATEDNINIPGYYSGYEDRIAIFEAIGSKRKSLAVFDGGSHSMFTDRTNTGGAVLNYQVKEATQELSVDFMGQILANRESTLEDWAQRHESILSKVVS
jgi:predicted dienelactone hydrolase